MAYVDVHRWLLINPYMTVYWNVVAAEKKNLFSSVLLNEELQALAPLVLLSLHFCARSFLAKNPICSSVAFQSRRCSGDLMLINSIIHEPVYERRRRGRWCQPELN